jgi:hypothetical protein
MKPGDLVKVAGRWINYEPIFSETDALGIVISAEGNSRRLGRGALVLVGGCKIWVALQNMELLNASR